jgi:hypothetical protein
MAFEESELLVPVEAQEHSELARAAGEAEQGLTILDQ